MVQSGQAIVMVVVVMVMAEATFGRVPPLCPDVACPKDYRPVCGSDGRTYRNQCVFNSVRCTNLFLSVAHFGRCGECPRACTKEYSPVCGSDGETYNNDCLLEVEKECYNPDLRLSHVGICGGDGEWWRWQ